MGCVALVSPHRGRHSGSHGRQPVGKGVKKFELSPRRVVAHPVVGEAARWDRQAAFSAGEFMREYVSEFMKRSTKECAAPTGAWWTVWQERS